MDRGLLAEFAAPGDLVAAAERLRARGYRRLEAYTPYPLAELSAVLRLRRSPAPRYMLAGALTGGALAYLIQWWTNAVDYPLNVGARPLHSAPAWVPITFEMAILSGALTGVVALLALTRLPRLRHPLFEVDGFERASVDRFWLVVAPSDPAFVRDDAEATLHDAGALRVVTYGEAP